MSVVAVLDVGKTNVKLTAAARDGTLLETLSLVNGPAAPPPYLHIDAARIEGWLFEALPDLASRHPVTAIVATGHGSAGALVDDGGLVMPMIDYEAAIPDGVTAAYLEAAGALAPLGCGLMPGAAHLARQLFWLESEWPERVARARWYLGGPQYWAFRLCGGAASEYTYLAAQSHLWDFDRGGLARIVGERGWRRLIPPLAPAWESVGRIRPDLARHLGLVPEIEVLCGIHDSSANFYRYQRAGLSDLALISTGTWIVGISDLTTRSAGDARGFVTLNMDVEGRTLSGILAMGGREFGMIAGAAPYAPIAAADVAALVAAGTMALPSFVDQDGVFPGSAARGRIEGPAPPTPQARHALALLYVALLTDACLDRLGADATCVLDGSFAKNPLYPALVAALRPGRRVLFNTDAYGTASGAALLASHSARAGPSPLAIDAPAPIEIPGIAGYRAAWRACAQAHNSRAKA